MGRAEAAALLATAVAAALFHWMPDLTRPGLFFGITVANAYKGCARARLLIRRFRIMLWACTAVAIGVAAVWRAYAASLLLESAGIAVAAFLTRRAARSDAVPASPIAEADLTASPERLPGGAPVVLLPIAALAAAGVWAQLHRDQLPPRLPVHWHLSGTPDRWVETNSASVFGVLVAAVLACLVLAGLAWSVLHWSRHIAAVGEAARAERRFRSGIVRLLLAAEYFIAMPPLFSLLTAPRIAMQAWSVALPATLLVLLVRLVQAGQGGTREAAGTALPVGDRTDDANWKLGIIYFNRNDTALLVEKRWGIGYTVNFGNPWAWVLMVALMAALATVKLLGG